MIFEHVLCASVLGLAIWQLLILKHEGFEDCLNDEEELAREARWMALLLSFQMIFIIAFTWYRLTLQDYLQLLKKLEEREAEIQKNMIMSYRE